MPTPLTIKRPKVLSQWKQFGVGILILAPLLGLWYVWRKRLEVHFEHPWLNLGAHIALIAIPLTWAFLISSPRLEFKQTEEEFLGASTFFDKLPMDWWTMFLMWPTPIFALVELGREFFTGYLAHPDALSTTPLYALGIMAVTFVLGFFYATILLGNSEPHTLVSPTGLRNGLIRFFEWEKIHHVSRHGELYSIYHQVNPALPATSFKLRDHQAHATFERYVAERRIPISNATDPSFKRIKIGVVFGFFFILAVCFWLRFYIRLSVLWIVLISFGIGTFSTIFLERFRGISKFGKYTPAIEASTAN